MKRAWRWVLGIVVAALLLAPALTRMYVDSLWFGSLGFSSVYWYSLSIKALLFCGFAGATFLILRGAFWALERAYAGYVLGGTVVRFDNQPVVLEPERFIKPLAWGVSIVWGLLIGMAMGARWQLFMLYLN